MLRKRTLASPTWNHVLSSKENKVLLYTRVTLVIFHFSFVYYRTSCALTFYFHVISLFLLTFCLWEIINYVLNINFSTYRKVWRRIEITPLPHSQELCSINILICFLRLFSLWWCVSVTCEDLFFSKIGIVRDMSLYILSLQNL